MEPNLPLGYRLRRDPDLLLLLRPDGSVAAAFSARGTNEEAVDLAAWEDRGGGDPSLSWDTAAAGGRAIAVAEGLARRSC